MRIIGLIFLMAFAPVAQAQPDGGALEIRGWIDADTGERVASSIGSSEVKLRQGYSPAAESNIVMWVEARQKGAEPPRVYIVGQRLRYTLPKETTSRGEFGRSDPKDPAYIGSPFSKVDLQTRRTHIVCTTDAYYCSRIDEHEIELSPELLRKFTVGGAGPDVPVALTRRNRIDWRIPKAELMGTLEALQAPLAE
jgi:hypothetical protein